MYKEYLLDDAEGTLGIEDEIAFLSSEIVSPQQATRLPLYIPTEAHLIQPRHVADGPCPYYRALWTAAMTTDCSPTLQTSPVVKDRHGTRSEKNPFLLPSSPWIRYVRYLHPENGNRDWNREPTKRTTIID